jgi:hypothetical protein
MTGLGIQVWALPLNGIRIAFGYMYLTELFDVLRILSNSYRLASTTGGGSGVVYGSIHGRFLPSHRCEDNLRLQRSGGCTDWDQL